jgi:hypothetical protein
MWNPFILVINSAIQVLCDGLRLNRMGEEVCGKGGCLFICIFYLLIFSCCEIQAYR